MAHSPTQDEAPGQDTPQAPTTGTTLRSGRKLPGLAENPDSNFRHAIDHDTRDDSNGTGEESSVSTPQDREAQDESLRQTRDSRPYPNYADDPDPLPDESPKAKQVAHAKLLREYSHELYVTYKRTHMKGEKLWRSFITSFRPHTVKTWTRSNLIEWTDLLTSRGVYVDDNRSRSPTEAIIDLLYRSSHISCKDMSNYAGDGHHDGDRGMECERSDAAGQHPATEASHKKDPPADEPEPADNQAGVDHPLTIARPGQSQTRILQPDPFGSSGDDSDTDEDNYPRKTDRHSRPGTREHQSRPSFAQGAQSDDNSSGLGSNGRDLVKSFIGQTPFSGGYNENLEETINIYEDFCRMCDVNESQKRRAITIMLKGTARAYYSTHVRDAATYDEAVHMLRRRYNNREKKYRLLSEWQEMRLSRAMKDDPTASEMGVFQTFVARMMAIQGQLTSSYKGDRYLRDRLQEAIDIPAVQDFLKDRPSKDSQELINRVGNKLSSRPKTAGAVFANWAIPRGQGAESTVMYTLGQNYGGGAKRPIKSFIKNRPNFRASNRNNNKAFQRRGRPSWMQGIKGCFVCKGDHRASERHSKEEVTKAINTLKSRQPAAFLSQDDRHYIDEIFAAECEVGAPGDSANSDYGDEADWADDGSESSDEVNFADIAIDDLANVECNLSNCAFLHGISLNQNQADAAEMMYANMTDKTAEFLGIKIDTGANKRSIMSLAQYSHYCQKFGLAEAIRMNNNHGVKGIGGSRKSVGTANIQIPFKDLGVIIDVQFLLLTGQVPTLLCLKDLYTNGLDISILRCKILCAGREQSLEMKNYFLVHNWEPSDMPFVYYTEGELRTIHRTFGHPAVKATEDLLRRARGEELDKETREMIRKISIACDICKKHSATPRRFKLTIGANDLRFNHEVQIDTMFLHNRPVLHMVDTATHFCAASFLRSQSSSEIWRTILSQWSHVYAGPPDYLKVDQGSNYTSKEMRANMDAAGIRLREAPIESPGAIGVVERYHAPLRGIYEKIRKEMARDHTDVECLKMAVFSINATVGPEGLCPMLLVFGVIPRPARSTPSATQMARAEMIDRAMDEVTKLHAKMRLAFGLKHTAGPKGVEQSECLRQLPAGSPVLVFRTASKLWEGPFDFISVSGETAVVQTKRGRRIFRSTCVKPYVRSQLNDAPQTSDRNQETMPEGATKEAMHGAEAFGGEQHTLHDGMNGQHNNDPSEPGNEGRHRKVRGSDTKGEFAKTRTDELIGLLEGGTFKAVMRTVVPEGMRVFGSRFIDQVKGAGDMMRKKSRLVAQNYGDEDAAGIATKAPTVQRYSQRVLLSLASSLPACKVFSRDVTQAYIQATKPLERPVYIKPPKEMGLSEDMVLLVVKPLYGIPESGLHWYMTYLEYHMDKLDMKRTTADPCVLVKRRNGKLSGLVALQVDDSLTLGDDAFLEEEEQSSGTFKSKERIMLGTEVMAFNGVRVSRIANGGIKMDQGDKIRSLSFPTSDKQFASKRAMAQYIGVNCRPDVCAPVQLVAPGREPTSKDEYRTLKKVITHLQATADVGLNFVPLELETCRLVLFTDASFANARDLKSQLGFLLLMADANDNANIVHFGSSRCQRVTRSVLASEIHSLVLGFDVAYVVQHMLNEIIGRKLKIEAYVDSRSTFDIVAKQGKTVEKRLQIDIHCLKQSYSNGELSKLGWIQGVSNPADSMTKNVMKDISPLKEIMRSNRVIVSPLGWATVSHEKQNCANVN